MQPDHTVTVEEAVQLLALVGDLSMGQPTGQSIRTGRLAERLALADGAVDACCAHARLVALLRWSGCTANAQGFTMLLGDDVAGREAMLSLSLPPDAPMGFTSVAPLAQIHCEVSGAIAQMMGLPLEVEVGLRKVWEHYDGGGIPARLQAPDIPRLVYYVNLASDLEIFARTHGFDAAMALIAGRADKKYPRDLVQALRKHAAEWLQAVEAPACLAALPALDARVPLSMVADVIELKLPWLLGYSRRVAGVAERAASFAGLSGAEAVCLARAALLHGVGRAAVPNSVWQGAGKLSAADWERVRLVPYWTARAAVQIPTLQVEAMLASQVYERMDGTGYFRDLNAGTLAMPQRILSAAAAFVALCMPRPWRAAHPAEEAARILTAEAAAGKFDAHAVRFIVDAADETASPAASAPARRSNLLSERETDVLRRLSLGESNKEAARHLQISPSTVRTHVESIFRKLGCSTRAAATLKGATLGLI